jgi:predicted transcriptional regulator of viral defense system
MASFEQYLDDRLVNGRAFFTREEALAALGLKPHALSVALVRHVRKERIASPSRGFYLILRPEERAIGAPDPAQWIDPLMKYLQLDYRVALLRAAAFHGSSHQAAMVFQVIIPRQLRDVAIGRQRLEFVYQSPKAFRQLNRPDWLDSLKSDAGFAKISGIELTLLDGARYFHKVGGINGLAQIVKDIGGKAKPAELKKAAAFCTNSSVRRLGYLLDLMGNRRQAEALRPLARRAKTAVSLNPAVTAPGEDLPSRGERVPDWRLIINETVEIDS